MHTVQPHELRAHAMAIYDHVYRLGCARRETQTEEKIPINCAHGGV